ADAPDAERRPRPVEADRAVVLDRRRFDRSANDRWSRQESPMPDAPCAWTESTVPALDLRTGAAQRHLIRDARVAEEIAIHHADVLRGHRSTHYAGGEEYARTRDQCLARLTAEIGSSHGIDAAQVAAAVGQRDPLLD